MKMLLRTGLLLLLPLALAHGQTANQILTVSPASAAQGTSVQVTFTLDTDAPPAPPATVQPSSVTLGTIAGTGASHPSQYTVTAQFAIPAAEALGAKDVSVVFPSPNGTVMFTKTAAFQVTAGSGVAAGFSATPSSGAVPLTVVFSNLSTGTITGQLWTFGDGGTSTEANPSHTYTNIGSYAVSLTVYSAQGSNQFSRANCVVVTAAAARAGYVVVDTAQDRCYNNSTSITAPAAGQPFYGQDAQCAGVAPAYTLSTDGLTVYDQRTGLTWLRSPDTSGDGVINASDKLSLAGAQARPAVLNAAHFGGFSDWRLPTIKELYSLMDFRGTDPSGLSGTDTSGLTPYINTNFFAFAYGDTSAGERIIDSQYASSTVYTGPSWAGEGGKLFGVNFADGRIKGYGLLLNGVDKTFFVLCVRGNPAYGQNLLVDNGDQTVTDQATGLMWSKGDSMAGMNWSNALAWVQARNAARYLGYQDWRLPNAKELQSIVDYSRSPDATASAAINPLFACTAITNEAGQVDYPWYWSGTTHAQYNGSGGAGAYVCFGRAMGYMNSTWVDVHGAGCQRSDPKSGSLSSYTYVSNGYYNAVAPQGDAVRLFNYVRLVRDAPAAAAWRFAFVGDTHVPVTDVPGEIAAAAVADGAQLLLVAGDIVNAGAIATSNVLQNQLVQWRTAMAPAYAAGIPVYVVRGNHENDAGDQLAIWTNFFTGAYAMPTNGPDGEAGLTYSFAYANALFVGLDNYAQIHRVNQAWLDRQLGTNTRPHVFVFGHEPAFKAFHTDCLDDYPDERNAFWRRLTAAGARVYLCGHDHFLNVARIDDGDGNSANDLWQFIVGTGGATNWPPQRYNYIGTNAPYAPVNLASVTNTYGYLLVEISGQGTNDLGVALTWKQRAYDTNSGTYSYVATTNSFTYTAFNRFADRVGDGVSDWWRSQYFGGTGASTNAASCAGCDPDGDGVDNWHEYIAGTSPTDAASWLKVQSSGAAGARVAFPSSVERRYTLYYTINLTSGSWIPVPSQAGISGTGGVTELSDPSPAAGQRYYRIGVQLP